jgi:hypothetical protein
MSPKERDKSPSIGWSRFAAERYRPGLGRACYTGAPEALVALILAHWDRRRPGAGRRDLEQVVVVPLPPQDFVSATVAVAEATPLRAELTRRQPDEDPYVEVRAAAVPEPARFASAVLYSAATLLENGGERSGDWDWEIVALQAGPLADEPMRPLTMARNFLAKPGGTPCEYSALEFAEAIWYWSARCGVLPDDD